MKIQGIMLSILSCSLLGCNGTSESVNIAAGPENDNGSIGIWFGETTIIGDTAETVGNETAEMVAIVSPDARFAYLTLSSNEAVSAEITIEGNEFESQYAAYYKFSAMERLGSLAATVRNGVLSGEVDASGIPLYFNAIPLTESGVQADLNLLSGNYATDGISFAIDSDGLITGSNRNGCILSGSVEIIDPHYPIYNLTLSMEACAHTVDVEGIYKGIAAYGVFPFNNNELPGLVVVAEGAPGQGKWSPWVIRHHLFQD